MGRRAAPRVPRLAPLLAVTVSTAAGAMLAFGCTFLVDFQDKPEEAPFPDVVTKDVGGDELAPDDAGLDAPAVNPCIGKPNGYAWDASDEYARCCNGVMVRTVTDEFCGTCEIACNRAKGQACEEFRGRYYCRGCDANAECWSKCCSKQFGGGSCAASDCNTGACNSALCTGGTVCVVPGDASNYCKY